MRLDLLSLRGCHGGVENAFHIANDWQVELELELAETRLRPDLVTKVQGTTCIVDVAVAYITPTHLAEA